MSLLAHLMAAGRVVAGVERKPQYRFLRGPAIPGINVGRRPSFLSGRERNPFAPPKIEAPPAELLLPLEDIHRPPEPGSLTHGEPGISPAGGDPVRESAGDQPVMVVETEVRVSHTHLESADSEKGEIPGNHEAVLPAVPSSTAGPEVNASVREPVRDLVKTPSGQGVPTLFRRLISWISGKGLEIPKGKPIQAELRLDDLRPVRGRLTEAPKLETDRAKGLRRRGTGKVNPFGVEAAGAGISVQPANVGPATDEKPLAHVEEKAAAGPLPVEGEVEASGRL